MRKNEINYKAMNEQMTATKAGRKPKFKKYEAFEWLRIQIKIPKTADAKSIREACHKLIKSMLLILLLMVSINSIASSYEIIGYSNKGHYEQVFGSALINDGCEIYIVVDSFTYYVKYSPETYRDGMDGKTQSRATCNGKACFIAINKGTLETIEIIFESETIKFYVK